MWRFGPIQWALAALLTLASTAASAEDRAIREDAQALFDQGLQHMLEGRHKMGCALIQRSLEIDPRPGTLFTLAECYGRSGKYASAVELYDEFLALYARMPPDQQEEQRQRYELSKQERGKLIKSVPWLTVVLPETAPSGTVVTRNNETFPANLFGVGIAVDPGSHVFTTRAPGGPLIEQSTHLSPGQRKTIVLDVLPPGADPPDPYTEPLVTDEPAAEPKGNAHRTWMWISAGVGAAALVTGAVTGYILLDKRQTIKEECRLRLDDDRVGCSREGFEASKDAQDVFAPVTTVALGVGAGALTIATILWLTDSDSTDEADTAIRVTPNAGVRAEGGFSASFQGRF